MAFSESLRLEAAPGTLLNLADCEEHLGRLASAWRDFRRAEDAFPASDERRAVSHERAATVAPRVPWMSIGLAPDVPPEARIFRDDVELDGAHLSEPVPLDPGMHSVLVVAPGRESRTITANLTERQTLRIIATAGSVLHETTAPPPPPQRHPTAAWLVGGAGLVAVGVGTYFGARALGERSVSDRSCAGTVCTSASGLDAYTSARSDARIADVALGLGLVGLAVGGVLWLATGSAPSTSGAVRVNGAGLATTW